MESQDERHNNKLSRRDLVKFSVGTVAASTLVPGLLQQKVFTPQKAFAQPAGQSKLQEVLNRKVLIVGTGSTNPPWHFEDAQGNLIGMDIDLARLVAKGLFEDAKKVQFVREAPDARIPNLVTNKVDVVFQFMTVTAIRGQQVEFTIPYYREGVALLVRRGGRHKNHKDLLAAGNRVKVSVLQNVGAEEFVHIALPKSQVLQLDSQATVIQALDSRRVDAAAVDQSTVRWLVVRFPDKYGDSGFGWYPQTYAAAIRPGDPVWLNFLNTALHEAMTGVEFASYKESFKKWFGITLKEPSVGFPVEFAYRTA